MKPVLFVTGHVPADRVGAFELLHERVGIELALYGGRHQHGAPPGAPPAAVPHRLVAQHEIGGLVRSGVAVDGVHQRQRSEMRRGSRRAPQRGPEDERHAGAP